MARGLGWFTIGLGLAGLVVPERRGQRSARGGLTRAQGLREVVTGGGLALSRDPGPWLWGRVAGDAFDIAAVAADGGRGKRAGIASAVAGLMAIAAIDAYCAKQLARETGQRTRARIGDGRFDYSDRSGFPEPPDAMRGAALRSQSKARTRRRSPRQG